MTRRRFIVEKFAHGRAVLSGEQAHHLARALRAQLGQTYELSDQRNIWLGRIVSVSPQRVEFELVEPVTVPSSGLRIILLASIFKFARWEWCLEKATELGVSEIIPVVAQRSEKHLVRAAWERRSRWEKLVRAAAQQARRVDVPRLGRVSKLADALQCVNCETRVFLSEAKDVPPLRSLLGGRAVSRSVALAVGPEGGWTDEEHELARQAGFVWVSLGRQILRVETAIIAALAIVRYELGDG